MWLGVALAWAWAACRATPPPESDPPATRRPGQAAPPEREAPRNAGVLGAGHVMDAGAVYGGITGQPDTEGIPGLPPLKPRGPCEEAIAHLRTLACGEKIERGDTPLVADIRDVVIESCAGAAASAAKAVRCVTAAKSLSDARSCPRAARPRSPSQCEALHLQILKLSLVDQTCPSDASRMSREREGYLIEAAARWVKAEGWTATCEKAQIPETAFRCVMKSATSDELARCGL